MTSVFNSNEDKKENLYLNCYSNCDTEAIVCDGETNFVFKGSPKIVVRKGEKSQFGDQILFQFLITKIKEKYTANSKHGVLEYYLPLKEGLKFLRETVDFLEGNLKEDGIKTDN